MKAKQNGRNIRVRPHQSAKASLRRQRPIHKRIFLHPLSVIAAIITGVVLAFSSLATSAATYNVSATVPAPPLKTPAVINSPADQTTFTIQDITVDGSCPNNSYVELNQNGLTVGVYICANNNFSIVIRLLSGTNVLIAQDYNLTDQAGPASEPVTLYYNPPSPPAQTNSGSITGPLNNNQPRPKTTSTPLAHQAPFRLSLTDYRYQVVTVGKSVSFKLDLNGGRSPYAITVLWGDGNVSTKVENVSGIFAVSHTYSYSSGDEFVIKAEAVDSGGNTALVQLIARIRTELIKPVAAIASTSFMSKLDNFIKNYSMIIWPVYLAAVIAIISFWLGEREELHKLRLKQARYAKPISHKT